MADKFYNTTVGSLETTADENGYINATKICNLFNKEFKQWCRHTRTRDIINLLAKKEKIAPEELLRTVEGEVEWQGTYVHPSLIIAVISWCSPDNVISMGKAFVAHYGLKYTLPKSIDSGKVDSDSGIYLLELGSVKKCRPYLNLSSAHDDEYLVCKYGTSHDIPRRVADCAKTCTFDDVIPRLIYSQYIDCRYNRDAKTNLTKVFNELQIRVSHERYKELIIFPKSLLETIKTMYDGLCYRYRTRP